MTGDNALADDDPIPYSAHRCEIRRKRRGRMRTGEHGICRECDTEYVWAETPFKQWVPRFAGTPFRARRR